MEATKTLVKPPSQNHQPSSGQPSVAERPRRFWELDALRGVAIIMVVIYHLAWDLKAMAGWDIDLYAGFWHYFQRVTATTFILLVGISLTLSYRRVSGQRPNPALFGKYARRGARLFAFGLVISAVTWVVLRQGYVQFGILHFIGVAIILAYPLLRYRYLNLALGLSILFVASWVSSIPVETGWLIWLGFLPPAYYAVDYFPLFPWFGVVLLGIFIGNTVYDPARRWGPLPNLSPTPVVQGLNLLGRHTLAIYLLHQPVLIAALILLGIVDIGVL